MEKVIIAVPLTSEAFSDFGSVMMASKSAPEREEYAGQVENSRVHAKPNLTYIHAAPKSPVIKGVERHAHSHQLFVPMKVSRYLVGVCPPTRDGGPNMDALKVFVATSGQSVNYNRGVWHSPLCVLDEPAEFVMLRWDDGGPEDTEFIGADQPIRVLFGE